VQADQTLSGLVKTAVSKAMPLLGTVLNLIWGNSSKPNSQSASKSDLQQAAQKPQTQQQFETTIKANLQTQLQPVGQVAAELGVINTFLDPSVQTLQQVIVIRTKLREKRQGAPDWVTIKNAWQLATIQMGKLSSIPDADLAKVRDAYLRIKLQGIRNANSTTVVSVGQDIANQSASDLLSDITTMQTTLSDMTAVSGYEFAELQADIQSLSDWARGAAAGQQRPRKQGPYIQFMDAYVPQPPSSP
jgi:hypothetical protein